MFHILSILFLYYLYVEKMTKIKPFLLIFLQVFWHFCEEFDILREILKRNI